MKVSYFHDEYFHSSSNSLHSKAESLIKRDWSFSFIVLVHLRSLMMMAWNILVLTYFIQHVLTIRVLREASSWYKWLIHSNLIPAGSDFDQVETFISNWLYHSVHSPLLWRAAWRSSSTPPSTGWASSPSAGGSPAPPSPPSTTSGRTWCSRWGRWGGGGRWRGLCRRTCSWLPLWRRSPVTSYMKAAHSTIKTPSVDMSDSTESWEHSWL